MIQRPKLIVVPREEPRAFIPSRKHGLGVRFKTELCDAAGRVEKVLTPWRHNMITDWGMDNLPTLGLGVISGNMIDYLHLGSTTETLKRVGGGVEFTVTWSDAETITVTSDTNFFESDDEGRTLFIGDDDWPELLISNYVGAQEVECVARNAAWLPGFTPPPSPAGPYTDVGVHYTNVNTLATQFTRFNTYDTGSSNNRADLTDASNQRFICQRIFLSSEVAGSDWTVHELGWGGSGSSTNVFGKAVLSSADTVPVGKRYRVTLQVYVGYTPIDLTGVSLDWGETVGTHVCDIRQERIAHEGRTGNDTGKQPGNAIRPKPFVSYPNGCGWLTSAFALQSIAWDDDAGFTGISKTGVIEGPSQMTFDSSYTSGTFTKTRTFRWPETANIQSATGLFFGQWASTQDFLPNLRIRPQSGTITKPSGWRIELAVPIHWTRELVN